MNTNGIFVMVLIACGSAQYQFSSLLTNPDLSGRAKAIRDLQRGNSKIVDSPVINVVKETAPILDTVNQITSVIGTVQQEASVPVVVKQVAPLPKIDKQVAPVANIVKDVIPKVDLAKQVSLFDIINQVTPVGEVVKQVKEVNLVGPKENAVKFIIGGTEGDINENTGVRVLVQNRTNSFLFQFDVDQISASIGKVTTNVLSGLSKFMLGAVTGLQTLGALKKVKVPEVVSKLPETNKIL